MNIVEKYAERVKNEILENRISSLEKELEKLHIIVKRVNYDS